MDKLCPFCGSVHEVQSAKENQWYVSTCSPLTKVWDVDLVTRTDSFDSKYHDHLDDELIYELVDANIGYIGELKIGDRTYLQVCDSMEVTIKTKWREPKPEEIKDYLDFLEDLEG